MVCTIWTLIYLETSWVQSDCSRNYRFYPYLCFIHATLSDLENKRLYFIIEKFVTNKRLSVKYNITFLQTQIIQESIFLRENYEELSDCLMCFDFKNQMKVLKAMLAERLFQLHLLNKLVWFRISTIQLVWTVELVVG